MAEMTLLKTYRKAAAGVSPAKVPSKTTTPSQPSQAATKAPLEATPSQPQATTKPPETTTPNQPSQAVAKAPPHATTNAQTQVVAETQPQALGAALPVTQVNKLVAPPVQDGQPKSAKVFPPKQYVTAGGLPSFQAKRPPPGPQILNAPRVQSARAPLQSAPTAMSQPRATRASSSSQAQAAPTPVQTIQTETIPADPDQTSKMRQADLSELIEDVQGSSRVNDDTV